MQGSILGLVLFILDINNAHVINLHNNCKIDLFAKYICTVSEVAGLSSQFATQNCLGCYSKLNVGSKFYPEVATCFPHFKIKNAI